VAASEFPKRALTSGWTSNFEYVKDVVLKIGILYASAVGT